MSIARLRSAIRPLGRGMLAWIVATTGLMGPAAAQTDPRVIADKLLAGFDLIIAHHENTATDYGALSAAAIAGVYRPVAGVKAVERVDAMAGAATSSGRDRTKAQAALVSAIKALTPAGTTIPVQDLLQASFKAVGGRNSYHTSGAVKREDIGSIGLEVTQRGGKPHVHRPLPNGPAAAAGIKADDELLSIIDDTGVSATAKPEPLAGVVLEQIVARLRGPVGRALQLRVRREGVVEPLVFTVKRAPVFEQSVTEGIIGDAIGYIRIRKFGIASAQETRDAVAFVRKEAGERFAGLIIDLRGNVGGLVDQATEIADHFLESGLITRLEGRNAADNRRVEATAGDITAGKPIVVLVNAATSDGAELLTAALQKNRRARVVGAKTKGQAAVTTVYQIKAPDALLLQTGRWFDPAGISWEGRGVDPDVSVADPGEAGRGGAALDAAVAAVKAKP